MAITPLSLYGAWRRMEPLLRQLKHEADRNDFQLLIVGFPVFIQVKADVLHDYPQRELARVAASMETPLLDMLPVFRKIDSDPLFMDYCHHTELGQRLIAKEILAFINENSHALDQMGASIHRP